MVEDFFKVRSGLAIKAVHVEPHALVNPLGKGGRFVHDDGVFVFVQDVDVVAVPGDGRRITHCSQPLVAAVLRPKEKQQGTVQIIFKNHPITGHRQYQAGIADVHIAEVGRAKDFWEDVFTGDGKAPDAIPAFCTGGDGENQPLVVNRQIGWRSSLVLDELVELLLSQKEALQNHLEGHAGGVGTEVADEVAVGVHLHQAVDGTFADDVQVLAGVYGDFAGQKLAIAAEEGFRRPCKPMAHTAVWLQNDDLFLPGVGHVNHTILVHKQARRSLQRVLTQRGQDVELGV